MLCAWEMSWCRDGLVVFGLAWGLYGCTVCQAWSRGGSGYYVRVRSVWGESECFWTDLGTVWLHAVPSLVTGGVLDATTM